jgi:hypothetical protein
MSRVELYQVSMKMARHREMLKKINSNYQGNISVENVMETVTFLRRYKFPFIIITGLSLAIFILRVDDFHIRLVSIRIFLLFLFCGRKAMFSCGRTACTKTVAAQPQQKNAPFLYLIMIIQK